MRHDKLSALVSSLLLLQACSAGNSSKSTNTDGSGGTGTSTNTNNTTNTNTNSDSASKLIISGTLAIDSSNKADTVVALSIDKGQVTLNQADKQVSAAIASGSLAIELPSSAKSDWVVLLAKEGKTGLADSFDPVAKLDSVTGFLGLPASGTETVIQLPVGEAKGTLDLGTVAAPDSGAVATATIAADEVAKTFDVSADIMAEIAKTDDIVRNAKNQWSNYNSATQDFFEAKPFFVFRYEFNMASLGASEPAPTSFAPTVYNYNGFGVYFKSSYTFSDPERFCSGGLAKDGVHPYFEVIPPGNIVNNSVTWGPSHTISNLGFSNCLNTASTLYYQNPRQGTIGFNIGGAGFSTTPIPAGVWKVNVDGSTLAAFDLALAEPVKANKAKTYVPKITLVPDATGTYVDRMEVEWYLYNFATSTFDKLTDFTVFNKNVTKLQGQLEDNSGTTAGSYTGNGVSSYVNLVAGTDGKWVAKDFTPQFKLPQKTIAVGGAVAEGATVGYEIAGLAISFNTRFPPP